MSNDSADNTTNDADALAGSTAELARARNLKVRRTGRLILAGGRGIHHNFFVDVGIRAQRPG